MCLSLETLDVKAAGPMTAGIEVSVFAGDKAETLQLDSHPGSDVGIEEMILVVESIELGR